MFIQIIDELNWIRFPINPDSKHLAEIPQEELDQIGTTKRFDLKTNTAVVIPDKEIPYYLENKDRMVTIDNLRKLRRDLEHLLDNDHRTKKFLDGEYTEVQWDCIAKERRGTRQDLRNTIKQLNELENLPSPLLALNRECYVNKGEECECQEPYYPKPPCYEGEVKG